MNIIKTISIMQETSDKHRAEGKRIAVVPTMGYLHNGHASLITKAKEYADIIITTLFVNPKQFAPHEDFEKYPRDFDRDFQIAESFGSDYLFIPDVREMYPIGFASTITISDITEPYEGHFRPGHFDGVATVVAKLFNATKPHYAVFGQKDYQQSLLIQKLNRDFNFGIEIIISPTIRESDGLAMSSRNTYLSPQFRKKAGILFIALEEAKHAIERGETDRKMINAILHKTLRTVPEIKIDYASSALADSLIEPDRFLPGEKVVLLIACFLEKTRLIDNSVVIIPSVLKEKTFVEGI